MDMQKLILERLRPIPGLGDQYDLQRLAQQVQKGQFQSIKHAFRKDGTNISTLQLSIPGLERQNMPNLNIINGEMVIAM